MKVKRAWILGLVLVTAGCRTLVDGWTPQGGEPEAPAGFKDRGAGEGGEAVVAAGEWWEVFRDPVLSGMMKEVEAYNPDVKAALARIDRANAVLGITGAERFPTVLGEGAFTRARDSQNDLLFPIDELEYDRYRLAVNASWELDLWGRIRGAYQRDQFKADEARALYGDVLLSLRAALGRDYFALRYAEREAEILREAVAVREEALDLQNALEARGGGTSLDVARARAELETTQAEWEGLERTRGKLEHAIATMTGRAPSEFEMASERAAMRVPKIPAGVPSELLSRRPDLRASGDALRAASQEVGVTKADFLPRFNLIGTGGTASLQASTLFAGKDSMFYAVGPRVDVPIFQAGRRVAAVAEAKALWEEAAENYRAALLTAVREVDDSLLDVKVLARQVATQERAAAAAARATDLAMRRYEQGGTSYFEVVEAQRTELDARRAANALSGERAAAAVQLIQALGGGW